MLDPRDIGPAGKDAVPALVERLKDPRPEIRREAILTLAAMDEAAIPALPQIAANLIDKDTAIAATYVLGRVGQIPKVAVIETYNKRTGGQLSLSITPEAIIQQNAKSDDKMLSTTSLFVLARVHPEDKELLRAVGQRLVERLKDPDAFVRNAAAKALAALPPAPEIMLPIWSKAFEDADETTIGYALDAIAALGPAAVPRLVEGLKHEKVRDQVIYVIGRLGPAVAPATPALVKLISDKDEHVAREAILAIANIGPGAKDAVPALTAALQQPDSPDAHAIVYALGRIGPEAAAAEPVLTGQFKNSDPSLAVTMLGPWSRSGRIRRNWWPRRCRCWWSG